LWVSWGIYGYSYAIQKIKKGWQRACTTTLFYYRYLASFNRQHPQLNYFILREIKSPDQLAEASSSWWC
jgi:hypothetical protein